MATQLASGAGTSAGKLLDEIRRDGSIMLSDVCAMFANPSSPDGIEPNTVRRWVNVGIGVPGGSQVRLGAVRIGGRWRTTKAEVERFLAATNPPK